MERVTDLSSLHTSSSIIYKCIYGSQAFGLATETSDVDTRGVFVLPKKQFYCLEKLEQISDERSNEIYWELEKFVALLLRNNPNALETLAVGEQYVQKRDTLFCELTVDMFLSAQCYKTFANYARTQLKKARRLNKKIIQPVAEQRKGVLDFCYVLEGYGSKQISEWLAARKLGQKHCGLVRVPHTHDTYALFIGADGEYGGIIKSDESEDVHTCSIPIDQEPAAIMTFNKDAYKTSCKAYNEYWAWVKNRNEDRYRINVEAGKRFDTKNMMHVFRLIGMAEDIVRKKQIVTERPERDALLKIKRGERSYEDLLREADARLATLEEEYRGTDLPPEPDYRRAMDVLFMIRDEFYARTA